MSEIIPMARLPDLLEEVDNKVQRLKAALAKLPQKPASDPVVTVMTMLESFQKDVALLVKGRPEAGRAGLIQSLRRSKGPSVRRYFVKIPTSGRSTNQITRPRLPRRGEASPK